MKITVIVVALYVCVVQGFVVRQRTSYHGRSGLAMSDEPMLGETEQLLVDHKKRRETGILQEYGRTVKKDGLDGLRALVWGIFDVTNIVFPMLGVALTMGLFLNMVGYGYYFDDSGFVIDTLNNIQQEHAFQAEAAKMAADFVDSAGRIM